MPSPVQSFWFGNRLSPIHCLGIQSFLANRHPYHLYVYEEVENVPSGVDLVDARTIAPREQVYTYHHGFGAGSVSAFSNEFRYRLLFRNGGWWVDTDVVCLQPFECAEEYVFATERHADGRVEAASCVMRAPAGAPILEYCIGACEKKDKESLEWGEIGPRLVEEAIGRFGLDQRRVAPDVFNPVDYFSYGELLSPGFPMERLAGSKAVHLWSQKWMTHYLDPDYGGAPDSLYAQLRRRYLNLPDNGDMTASFEKHDAFQRKVIETLRVERDESNYALEREQKAVQFVRDELAVSAEARAVLEGRVAAARSHAEAANAARAATEQQLVESKGALTNTEQRLQDEQRAGTLLRAELDGTARALAGTREAIARMQSSRSWRLTAPLRAVFDFLSSLGRSDRPND